jgi:hypothetical protein
MTANSVCSTTCGGCLGTANVNGVRPKVFCDFATSGCFGLVGCYTDITNVYCDIADEGSGGCSQGNFYGCGATDVNDNTVSTELVCCTGAATGDTPDTCEDPLPATGTRYVAGLCPDPNLRRWFLRRD